MISNGSGSNRPASSITVPGTSHAIASSAGNWVTAANAHPGTHHQRWYPRLTADAAEAIGTDNAPGADRTAVTARVPLTGPPLLLRGLSRTDPADSPPAVPSLAWRGPRSRRRTDPTVDGQPETRCSGALDSGGRAHWRNGALYELAHLAAGGGRTSPPAARGHL